MPSETKSFRPMVAVAAVLAWLVPGAGHLYLRRRARGWVIFFTVGLTFWSGVAMGGVMTVYSQGDAWWWFAADMLTGAHGLAAWKLHHRVFDPVLEEAHRKFGGNAAYFNLKESDQSEVFQQIIAKELADRHLALVSPADTVARAYSGVAGLMNLLCVFDAVLLALMGRTGEPPPQPPAKPAPPAKAPVPAPPRPPIKTAAEAPASLQTAAGATIPATEARKAEEEAP